MAIATPYIKAYARVQCVLVRCGWFHSCGWIPVYCVHYTHHIILFNIFPHCQLSFCHHRFGPITFCLYEPVSWCPVLFCHSVFQTLICATFLLHPSTSSWWIIHLPPSLHQLHLCYYHCLDFWCCPVSYHCWTPFGYIASLEPNKLV